MEGHARDSAIVLLCALLLAGCGQGHDESAVTRSATRADLPLMVLPREAYGRLGRGLARDDGSGWVRNREAADDSVDPRDTARTLALSGRIDGYSLVYEDPKPSRPGRQTGPSSLHTEVELFRDEATAAAYLRDQQADFQRARGHMRQGVKIVDVDGFEVGDVGEEAAGLEVTVATREIAVFGTAVAFRRGRIVASAGVINAQERESKPKMVRVARALDDRIEGVMAGAIKEPALRRPDRDWWEIAPDPRTSTLVASDLGLRMARTHRGYTRTAVAKSYVREYESEPGERLGGSTVLYLRTMAMTFRTTRLALREQRFTASRDGSLSFARRFVRSAFRRADISPYRIEARPLPARAADTAASQFFMDAPKGRLEGVLVGVRRGRLRATVLVMGLDPDLDPSDVLPLRAKLRAALRG